MYRIFPKRLISLVSWLFFIMSCIIIYFVALFDICIWLLHLCCCILSPPTPNPSSSYPHPSSNQGVWSNHRAASSWSQQDPSEGGWDGPKNRQLQEVPVWSMRVVKWSALMMSMSNPPPSLSLSGLARPGGDRLGHDTAHGASCGDVVKANPCEHCFCTSFMNGVIIL